MTLLIIPLLFFAVRINCSQDRSVTITVTPPLSLGGGPPASQAITPSSYRLPSTPTTPEVQQQRQPGELSIDRLNRQLGTQEPIVAINDSKCNQLWSQVYSLLEESLESHPDTPYQRILESFRHVLEDIGILLLIDAANTALGPKGQRTLVKDVERLRKKFAQLGNRKNALVKYPEYASLIEHYNKNMVDWDGHCGSASGERALMCKACYLPAYLADFILNAILIEDETGYQLVNFQESVSNIVDNLTKEIKKRSKPKSKSSSKKKQPQKEIRGTILDQKDIKDLEKFQAALKAKTGRRGESEGPSTAIIIILVIFLIVIILVAVIFLMRRKK